MKYSVELDAPLVVYTVAEAHAFQLVKNVCEWRPSVVYKNYMAEHYNTVKMMTTMMLMLLMEVVVTTVIMVVMMMTVNLPN